MRALNCYVIFSFCLISLIIEIQARIYYKNVRVRHSPAEAHFDALMERGFGFLGGGELHFSLQCPPSFKAPPRPNFWLLFCSTSDAREFSRMTSTQLNFDCQRLNGGGTQMARADAYCKRQRIFENMTSEQQQYMYHQSMEYSYFYTFILLQCPQPQDQENQTLYDNHFEECKSRVLALNPGRAHLSSDELHLPLIYTVVNLLWGVLAVAWSLNWVIFHKYSNRLHRLISWAPMFKVILIILNLLWWQEIAMTGIESVDLASVRHFVQSIEDALLFVTMMIIAEGWGVVRCHIKHYRWTSLLLLFALFATSLMCVHWVHRYFLAFSVCCVVFMMYKTLKWSSHNIELLRRRRRKIRRFIARHNLRYSTASSGGSGGGGGGSNNGGGGGAGGGGVTLEQQLSHKLSIFHRFRLLCVLFSMAYALAVTLSTFLAEYTSVRALTLEGPELLIYVSLGVLFRLRNFAPYERIELVPPREPVLVLELPDVCDLQPHVVLALPINCKVEKETQTPRRSRWRK